MKTNELELIGAFSQLAVDEFLAVVWEADFSQETSPALGKVNQLKIQAALADLKSEERPLK